MLPERLKTGYTDFVSGRLRQEQARFEELAETGQKPKIMIIGCCDSRVSPEVIFNARPGEIFVVRNVANLMPPHEPDDRFHGTSAALEFAMVSLKVEHVVVLGHARCGGIRAFAASKAPGHTPLTETDFIGKWMSLLENVEVPKRKSSQTLDDYAAMIEVASIRQQLANLRTYPCVQSREGRGRTKLHGCYFNIATGHLAVLDEETGQLSAVMEEQLFKRHMQAEAVPAA
jgi:carbonic anhydrase